jgi:hypothetical protein
MGDIVQLRPKSAELSVYECQCGSQQWFLTPDGRCICAGCNQMTKRLICYDVEPHGTH